MNDGRVVSNFILQALQNESITVTAPATECWMSCLKPSFFLFYLDLRTWQADTVLPVRFWSCGRSDYANELKLHFAGQLGESYRTYYWRYGRATLIPIVWCSAFTICFFPVEFAQIIKSIVNSADSTVRHLPAVEDDPQRRRPDISRAKKILNWEPKVLQLS